MLELNQKVYPKEAVVGFFFTQKEFTYDIAALNSFYFSKESNFIPQGLFQAPLILTLDPEMSSGSFEMKVSPSLFPLPDLFAGVHQRAADALQRQLPHVPGREPEDGVLRGERPRK